MRQHFGRAIAVATATVMFGLAGAACSSSDSSEPVDVEFIHGQAQSTQPFTATGAAVEANLVCAGGTMRPLSLESMEGDEITEGDWADMFDAALESDGVAEMYVNETWTCDGDDGSFTLKTHTVFDFAVFAFEGQQDVGTWEITGATDGLENLTGSGDTTLDWEGERVILTGAVER